MNECFSDYEQVMASAKKPEPLKIMISGAPASGKGTQCELITQKVSFFVSPPHNLCLLVARVECVGVYKRECEPREYGWLSPFGPAISQAKIVFLNKIAKIVPFGTLFEKMVI